MQREANIRAGEGAELGGRSSRVAGSKAGEGGDEAFFEFGAYGLDDDQTFGGDAALAAVCFRWKPFDYPAFCVCS